MKDLPMPNAGLSAAISQLALTVPEADRDELFLQAVEHVVTTGRASTTYIQRTFGIGYNRASQIIEKMQELGIVSPADYVGKRTVVDSNLLGLALTTVASSDAAPATLKGKDDAPRLKETEADREVREGAYRVHAAELRSFIERYERLEAEKKDIADQQKEVMAEAKGRGYDVKILRRIVALRKREPNDIAEEEAVLELYKDALGMS